MKLILVNNQSYLNGTKGQKLKGNISFLLLLGFAIPLCNLNLPRYFLYSLVYIHIIIHVYFLYSF